MKILDMTQPSVWEKNTIVNPALDAVLIPEALAPGAPLPWAVPLRCCQQALLESPTQPAPTVATAVPLPLTEHCLPSPLLLPILTGPSPPS